MVFIHLQICFTLPYSLIHAFQIRFFLHPFVLYSHVNRPVISSSCSFICPSFHLPFHSLIYPSIHPSIHQNHYFKQYQYIQTNIDLEPCFAVNF